jgi:hypothetical protein
MSVFFPPGSRIRSVELPYLDKKISQDRLIPVIPFFNQEDKDWYLFFKEEDDTFIRLAGGEVVTGVYLAEQPVDCRKDFALPFFTFILQHVSSRRVFGLLHQLTDDIHNFSSILQKYLALTSQIRLTGIGSGTYQLFRPEVEYLIILIRSYYDLFQKLAKQMMAIVHRLDVPKLRLADDLPDSFTKMVLSGDIPRLQEDIEKKFRLPASLAAFYAGEAQHFLTLRKIRVAIEHHGFTPHLIFQGDKGLSVPTNAEPWCALSIWQPETTEENHLGSLRLLFLQLIHKAIRLPDRFIEAYASCVGVLPPLAPGWSIYLRDYFSHHLVNINAAIAQPWEWKQGDTPPDLDR